MLFVVLVVTLGLVASSPVPDILDSDDVSDTVALPFLLPVEDSLKDLFHEVGKVMKETNSMLEKTMKEVNTELKEATKNAVALKDLPPNYHNESVTETKVGNATIVTKQEITKKTDKETGSTYVVQSVVSSLKDGDKTQHDCIVDEDCRPGNYCHLSSPHYRCLPCKEEETCTRDGECCEGHLCVWGQCTTSSRGESGTICESQQDCGPGLCCAVHTSLLFPVCTPLPGRGEQCQTPNLLLELFTWELESEVPVNLCPCPRGLVCQLQSHSLMSVCEEPSLVQPKRDPSEATEEDLSLITRAPQDQIAYDDGIMGLDLGDADDIIDEESELVPQPQFVDFI